MPDRIGRDRMLMNKQRTPIWRRLRVSTAPYRVRFGTIPGLLCWASLQREKLLPKGRLFPVQVPGYTAKIWLRAGSSDRQVFDEIITGNELDFELPDQPKRVLDLGANIGLSSVYLANRYPEARILSLEVDSGNVDVLRRNTNSYKNITIVPKAVWSQDGYVRIINPHEDSWAFRVTAAKADDDGAIEAISIKTLLENHGWPDVDLVKMDIEGAEFDLLDHYESSEWISRVSVLAVELHDRFRPGCSAAFSKATQNYHARLQSRASYTVAYLDR